MKAGFVVGKRRLGMKKWLPVAVSLSLVLLAAIWWSVAQSSEPSYGGRSLSCWLSDLYQSNLPFPEHSSAEGTRERAQDAIRHMGTNTLPFLLKMLRSSDSQLKLKLVALANRQHLIHVPSLRTREYHVSASFALIVLGPTAKAAEPELVNLMFYGEQDVRLFAKMIVKQLDPEYMAKLDDMANASAK
jgi:hypothetical protein